jgi:hypothetical protein
MLNDDSFHRGSHTAAVYLAELTTLDHKQTQSRMARLIGHVSHDALKMMS